MGAINGAQYADCDKDTVPVGSFSPNGYGLFDMAGNAWEWVWDWFSLEYYDHSPYENPTGPEKTQYKVIRGGSWYGIGTIVLKVNYRSQAGPAFRSYQIGFRCVVMP
jgi:formylglycine-generating enzyme required for sulfatase activity